MIELADVRDWLKTLGSAEHYYIGKLDAKQDKSIGVYSRATTGTPPGIALGGAPVQNGSEASVYLAALD